jgi:hypothetical protein
MNKNMLKNLKLWKKIILITITILILGVVFYLVWAINAAKAETEYLDMFYQSSNDSIIIKENSNYWEISPKTCAPETCSKGVIFYTGAFVDPKAYFYKLSFLAQSRKLFIAKHPLNLAFFNINLAQEIISNNTEIKTWTIGGHSLGGAMACEFAKNNTSKINNLLLIGSYCVSSIKKTKINIINIHGTQDGVLNSVKYTENFKNLTIDTTKDFPILGMNHAQAGNYGEQIVDNKATKTDEEVKNEIEQILNTNI